MLESIMDFMSKYEILVRFSSPIITGLIALLNIYFVFLVFKLNSKLSQSKLSVLPFSFSLADYKSFSASKRNDGSLINLEPIVIKKDGSDISKGPVRRDRSTVTGFTVKNEGALASSNIVIVFTMRLYGTKFNYNTGTSFFYNLKRRTKRVLVFKRKKRIRIPYIGPNEEKFIGLFVNRGEFREVEIVLNKIKANRFVYFKEKFLDRFLNPVVMFHYVHPSLDQWEFMNDKEYMILLGADSEKIPKKEKIDNEKEV